MKKITVFLIVLFFLPFTSFAVEKYIDNGDGTITDTSTTLMWQKSFPPEGYNWSFALTYCGDLSLAGQTDWRLPTLAELESIIAHGSTPPRDPIFIFHIGRPYWTTTESTVQPGYVWGVDFRYGSPVLIIKTGSEWCRCVRGGSSLPPTIITSPATSVTSSSATMNGTVNPNGGTTTVTFEYGTDTSYGSTATATQSPITGISSQSVSVGLTGLTPSTTYHFRVKATNNAGTTYGDDQTFVTSNSGAILHIPSDYSTIQAGINAASNGDTVLVADGTYKGTGNKNLDFKGKAITVKSENGASACIIDCEGEGQGFHFYSGEGADSLLSGFTITNGVSAGYGGGIDCRFSSSPTISDCIISGNMGATAGGGVAALQSSSPTITRCIISGNTAGSWAGGILCLDSSSPTITNCLITGNEVLGLGNGGGGIDCWQSSSPLIVNSTISGNIVSQFGGGIFSHDTSSPTVKNSIIWGNTPNQIQGFPSTVTYSDIQGGYSGAGNIDSDPLFAGSGDYHLTANSLCSV